MTELKLKQLHRGYVLTDFDGNEVGIKDSTQAMEEIRKLLKIDKKSDLPIVEEHTRKTKNSTIELHRNIFENAKEQISSTGKVNCAKIARELDINNSTVHVHIKKMNSELEILIKKWKEERDKQMPNVETGTDTENNSVS